MRSGLGRALQDAMDGKDDVQHAAPTSSPLLNARRRRIFEYLCLRPFATSGRIAGELRISSSSVNWHLDSLVSEGFVVFRRESRFYYPKDFVDVVDAEMFISMHGGKRSDALRLVFEAPGTTQAELSEALRTGRQTAGKIASDLERQGLISKVQDGRFVRWFPTSLLKEKQEAQRARSRAFIDTLLKRFEDEKQTPQVLRRTETEFQVRIGKGRSRGVLSIPLDPYGALVS